MCVGFLLHARDRAPLPAATQLFGRGPGTAVMLVARCVRPLHAASAGPLCALRFVLSQARSAEAEPGA